MNSIAPNNSYMRSLLAKETLSLISPSIRRTLLDEPAFLKEYGIRIDAFLKIGDTGISIQCSELFKSTQAILSGKLEDELTDINGQKWVLKIISGEEELPKIAIFFHNQYLVLPVLAALSPEKSIRLRFLDETSCEVNLPSSDIGTWRGILMERPLDNNEIDEFHNEFSDTPIEKARTIGNEIINGQINISTLVPNSRTYFERLVGTYDGSISIRDYAISNGGEIFNQLSKWQPYEGFLCSLLLASHSSMTSEINVDQMTGEEIVKAFDFLDKYGDRISQMGAIEIGLRILPSMPEIEPYLVRLIKQIRDDDVNNKVSGFRLLSALFIFVDGELSHTHLLSTKPPFYRRLASLSQAALICRQFINRSIDTIDQFSNWAFNMRAEQFFMQSLADMRIEPCWYPDLATALQFKVDFIGRILIAAKNYEHNIRDDELRDLVFSTKPGSLSSLDIAIYSLFPGPLDGINASHITMPNDMATAIKVQLESKDVGPSSFIALVNSTLIYNVNVDQAELAAKVVKLGGYRFANIENKAQLLTILNGLASVAAIARSRTLADELKILVRNYMRDGQYILSTEEAMVICLTSAASCYDFKEWLKFVGDWITELAFSNLKNDDGNVLHSRLLRLCHAVPELWHYCGRADAALIAYNNCRHPA